MQFMMQCNSHGRYIMKNVMHHDLHHKFVVSMPTWLFLEYVSSPIWTEVLQQLQY